MRPKNRFLKPALCVVGILAVTALVSIGGPAVAKSDQVKWKAVSSSGKVEAQGPSDDGWHKVTRGTQLEPGTQVRTGREGRTTLTLNSSIVIVRSDSEITLETGGASGMETTVRQSRGRVLYEVDRRKTPHFEVVTPYLVAGVKGTAFDVDVTDKTASVGVQRGRVEVTNGFGERMDLDAGDSVFQTGENNRMERADLRALERRRHAEKTERWNDRKAGKDAPLVQDQLPRADTTLAASDRGDRDDDSDDSGSNDDRLTPGSDFAGDLRGNGGRFDGLDDRDDESRDDDSADDAWSDDRGDISNEDEASVFDDLEDDTSGKSDEDPIEDDPIDDRPGADDPGDDDPVDDDPIIDDPTDDDPTAEGNNGGARGDIGLSNPR